MCVSVCAEATSISIILICIQEVILLPAGIGTNLYTNNSDIASPLTPTQMILTVLSYVHKVLPESTPSYPILFSQRQRTPIRSSVIFNIIITQHQSCQTRFFYASNATHSERTRFPFDCSDGRFPYSHPTSRRVRGQTLDNFIRLLFF